MQLIKKSFKIMTFILSPTSENSIFNNLYIYIGKFRENLQVVLIEILTFTLPQGDEWRFELATC